MKRVDQDALLDALSHLEALRGHMARSDLDDQTVADAVCLRLAAAIEAVSTIDVNVRTEASATIGR